MKTMKNFYSILLAVCILSTPISAFASNIPDDSFDYKVQELASKYGVEISILDNQTAADNISDEEKELEELEQYLINSQNSLRENNEAADEAWQNIINSGRLTQIPTFEDRKSTRATHTVYCYKTIGSYYPNGTTIQCSITANMVYSSIQKRNFWGAVQSTNSKLYSGKGTNWKETKCTYKQIDSGRTYYVEVYGDLTEKYTLLLHEYTVTSTDWKIWYEAICPS